ncbi:MAG: vitamin K epoxide reductase family protein [Patescibacteria group bacterium]
MPFVVTFIVLSLGGIIDSGYLFYKHRKKKPLVCPMNHDCSVVTESRWAHIFGIRNEVLGFLFYVGTFVGIFLTISVPSVAPLIYKFLFAATGIGLLLSFFLVIIQKYVIRNYCFYCLISAVLTALLFLNSIALLKN